jgi:hypothetical protein
VCAFAYLNPLLLLNNETTLIHIHAIAACSLAKPVAGLLESAVRVQGADSTVFGSPLIALPVKTLFERTVKMTVFLFVRPKTSKDCRRTLIIN